jgi:UTP:GlnB (protein PII) uridylyltransferase
MGAAVDALGRDGVTGIAFGDLSVPLASRGQPDRSTQPLRGLAVTATSEIRSGRLETLPSVSRHALDNVSGLACTMPRFASRSTSAGSAQVVEFLETMPPGYRERFALAAVRQHARIASARGSQPARVGRFDVDDPNGPALCVVAVDAPGVLAAISASLMLEGFDVMQAEAFTRTPRAGEPEALDLFWVRRTLADHRGPASEEDAAAIQGTLLPLLRGEVGVRRRSAPTRAATPAAAQTYVHFVESETRHPG